ncbi:MAG TPA: hypothetical protein VF746_10765 [Longimicrobium sp.]|jgi:hypothetical protein
MYALRLRRLLPVATTAALTLAGRAAAQPARTVALPDLGGLRSIVIIDEWNGLSPLAPVRAAYGIDRQDETFFFAGSGNLSVAGASTGARQRYVMVALPDSVTRRFLAALAAVPVAERAYQPVLTRTDDYPSLTIRLEFVEGTVEFSSTSQGEGMRPWRVRLQGPDSARELVSDSDAPWRALRALHPFLKRDVLEALKRQPAGAP